MEPIVAVVVVVILVVIIALILAVVSNRQEEKSQKSKRNNEKRENLRKKQSPRKKTVAKVPIINYASYDGDEDEEKSMLEFLRGTDDFKAQEAKEEKRRKARAEKKVAELSVGKTTRAIQSAKSDDSSEEDVEYVLIKRKKPVQDAAVTSKKSGKKSKNPAVSVDVKTAPQEGQSGTAVAAPQQVEGQKSSKKAKTFFKKGVFQEIKDQVTREQQEKTKEEDEKAAKVASRSNRKKEGTDETAPVEENQVAGSEAAVEGRKGTAVGPRGANRPPRDPNRPPREPREILPPPKPQGGSFETASLDDMLSAISTHYQVHKPRESFFSKIPRPALFRILHRLSIRDVARLSRVNHYLNKICRDEKLWRSFCERDLKMKFSEKGAVQKKFKQIYKEERTKTKQPIA